jgi:hypothetical protein
MERSKSATSLPPGQSYLQGRSRRAARAHALWERAGPFAAEGRRAGMGKQRCRCACHAVSCGSVDSTHARAPSRRTDPQARARAGRATPSPRAPLAAIAHAALPLVDRDRAAVHHAPPVHHRRARVQEPAALGAGDAALDCGACSVRRPDLCGWRSRASWAAA